MSVSERLWRRLQNTVGWGRTTGAQDDSGTVGSVQHKTNDLATRDAVPVVMHFGFSSCLPVGTDTVTVHVQGSSSNGVIIATNHQPSRPTGQEPGESMIFNEAGDHVHIRNGGTIEVQSSGLVVVNSPSIHCTGTVTIDGDCIIGGKSFLAHEHPYLPGPGPLADTGPPV